MKTTTKMMVLCVITAILAGARAAEAYTNPPVPNTSGVTTEVCDVRNNLDYGAGESTIEKSLRHRVDLFNAEFDGGPQKCIFGIYFLDPYTIKMKQPLRIRALKHTLKNGLQAGTYISGSNEAGNPMGVTLDASSFTGTTSEQCAIMIESGLASIQQVHDVTILVSAPGKAICDFEGNDLMNVEIPETTVRQNCSEGDLASE